MEFKELTISDKSIFDDYLQDGGRNHSDFSFADMLCWEHVFRHKWCIAEHCLFIKVEYHDGHVEYRQPLGEGEGEGEGDASHLIHMMEEDAASNEQPLVITGLTPEWRTYFRERCPDYGIAGQGKNSDYIYYTEDLRSLKGKKYQQKRNHVNKFESEYRYRYVELTPDLFPDCLALETEWLNLKRINGDGILSDEQLVIKKAFDHFNELGLLGGALYVGSRMVAFTFGSALNEELFCTHIEKANISYDGVFAVINKIFAEHIPRQYKYIDREDDAGLSGLRKSKMSYHPLYLSEKMCAMRLTPLMIQVRSLWLECFTEDTVDDVDDFLLNRFNPSRMLSYSENGKLVSMLHILPFGEVAYIFALATAAEYRCRGISSGLCLAAIQTCRRDGFSAMALIPSQSSLRSWYSRMGFAGDIPIRFETSDRFDFGTGNVESDRAMVLPLREGFSPGKELVLSDEE